MKTQKVKPIFVYAPITRVDEEKRLVEAYAFVNEVVEGEGGIRLKRTAMEAATPGYMEWANVRRMHTADAVGVASSVDWDQKGAHMTLEVVDDDAWNKVKRGVYKGLSVGVAPVVMRGKDVESCRWVETSLVDRPKDPDARIIATRADDMAQEYEAEELTDEPPADPAAVEPAATDRAENPELTRLQTEHFETLSRLETLQAQHSETLTRLEVANAELQRVSAVLSEKETALTAAKAEITRLEALPNDRVAPVRFPQALDRTFLANQCENTALIETKRAEYKRIAEEAAAGKYASAEQQQAAAAQINLLRVELNQLGVAP